MQLHCSYKSVLLLSLYPYAIPIKIVLSLLKITSPYQSNDHSGQWLVQCCNRCCDSATSPRVVMGSWVRVPHPSSTFLFVFSTNVFIPLCPGGSLNVKKTLTLSVDLESSVLSKKQKKREVVDKSTKMIHFLTPNIAPVQN